MPRRRDSDNSGGGSGAKPTHRIGYHSVFSNRSSNGWPGVVVRFERRQNHKIKAIIISQLEPALRTGISSPALLPSSGGAKAEAPELGPPEKVDSGSASTTMDLG
jgi:hypothetical protein